MSTNLPTCESIRYETPKLNQAPLLERFFLQSLAHNFSYFSDAANEAYTKAWQVEALQKRLGTQNDLLICAWAGEELAGLISGSVPEGGVGSIIWLSVLPTFQNRNIGAHLLTAAKKHYQQLGAHKMKLTVADARAVKFYQREGFIIEGVHNNHWWNLDFWAMAHFISGSQHD